jgi:membrane-associated phospholipid phosphatase
MNRKPAGSSDHRTWKQAWADKTFRFTAAGTLLCAAIVVTVFSRFLQFIEARQGAILEDPILHLFTPKDVTWVTFSLIYICLIVALSFLIRNPDRLLVTLQSYAIMVVTRMLAMYLSPLDPPPGMIPLKDPFVEFIVGGGEALTRDLFFSGHTSTMFLLTLTAASTRMRTLFLVCTAAVGFCVVWQHVHYSFDVVAAPFFAYGAYRIVTLIHLRGTVRPVKM